MDVGKSPIKYPNSVDSPQYRWRQCPSRPWDEATGSQQAREADGINPSFSALIRNASVPMFGITALPMAAAIAAAAVDSKTGPRMTVGKPIVLQANRRLGVKK